MGPLFVSIAILAIAGYGIYTLTKWGTATRKREEEWEKAGTVEIIDEAGETHVVERQKEDQANATTITA